MNLQPDTYFRDGVLELMTRTGYNCIQENGQRKYGPPPGWIGPPPPKGSEVFVGKLPRDMYEDELVPVFEQVGRIYELRLMMEFSNSNRGFAFITYTNKEDANQAVKRLNDYEIRRGRRIGVCMSTDNCRLFIGGIPKNKNKDEIFQEISRHTEGVTNVILYNNAMDKSKSRGFAFIEYKTHRDAAIARRKLVPGQIRLFDHVIAVDWAQPEPLVEDETMKKVTVLYARNLALLTSEEELRRIFSIGGSLKIEKVKKIRDFAFIHYMCRREAELAMQKLNGKLIDDCEVEVTWAKPPTAQKQKLSKMDPAYYNQLVLEGARRKRSEVKPTQLLTLLCQEKGWGQPVFQVSHIVVDAVDLLFACKVIVPECGHFVPNKASRSPEEAKNQAAQYVLTKIGLEPPKKHFPKAPGAAIPPDPFECGQGDGPFSSLFDLAALHSPNESRFLEFLSNNNDNNIEMPLFN